MTNRLHKLTVCGAVLALLLPLVACKTTEANYRAAYEAARAKKDADNQDLMPSGMRLTNYAEPSEVTVDSVTFPMATEYIRNEDKTIAGRDSVQRYTVVVGAFKQVFNARMLAKRLSGSAPEVIVFQNGPGMYMVGTMTTPSAREARAELTRVQTDTSVHPAEPFPYVVRAAHHAR